MLVLQSWLDVGAAFMAWVMNLQTTLEARDKQVATLSSQVRFLPPSPYDAGE